MELKLPEFKEADVIHRFNRTFMELKSLSRFVFTETWCCFNRTFMELKYVNETGSTVATEF